MHRRLAAVTVAFTLTPIPPAHAHGSAHDDSKDVPAGLDPAAKPFGRTGDPKKMTRTVNIGAADAMRYTPAEPTVWPSATLRFIVRNVGKVRHGLLGTMTELRQHAESMRRHVDMEHGEPDKEHLAQGQSGEVIWQLTVPDELHFG